MCVIVVKPSGVALPPFKTFQNCWEKNDDGAGYMHFTDDGKVRIRKGFMQVKHLYDSLTALPDKVKEGAIVVHLRIKTHGKVNTECCHPFPLVDSYSKMGAKKSEASIGVAHNGILDIEPENDKVSDTMAFIKHVMMKHIDLFVGDDMDDLLGMAIGTNRFALMIGHLQKVQMIGTFVEDAVTKCIYSNESFKDKPEVRTTCFTNTYDDDWWEKYSNGYGSTNLRRETCAPSHNFVDPSDGIECKRCVDVYSPGTSFPCVTCIQHAERPFFLDKKSEESGVKRNYTKIYKWIEDNKGKEERTKAVADIMKIRCSGGATVSEF